MKTILNKWEWHYTFLLLALSLVLTGYYVNLLIFTSLIVIHEFGHIVTCVIMGVKIKKVVIYPYGGMIKLDSSINQDINEDISIAISGLLFQTVFFVIVSCFYYQGVVREYVYQLFVMYHYSMFFFNILPIYPLDGSKVLNLLMSKYLPFRLSNILTFVISIIVMVVYFWFNMYEINYSYIMIISIVIRNLYQYYKELNYIFHRFLLERYLYSFDYSRICVIDDKKKMYKNRRHFFWIGKRKIDEKEFLDDYFKKSG